MPYDGGELKPLVIGEKSKGRGIKADCPIGCHMQFIGGVEGCFSFGDRGKDFDRLLKRHHGEGTFAGEYFTGTLVSITSNSAYFEDTVKALKDRDFQLLASQKGAHGNYKMLLYGRGFTLPKPEKKEKE